jgi:hypothetical protein
MSEVETRIRSPLELGVAIALDALGFAAVTGFVAVLDADGNVAGFGKGFGIAFAILLGGGAIAAALACLRRGVAELASLTTLVVSGLGVDLLVLALWQEIEDEGYGKLVGLAFAWSFLALVVLGLTLTVGRVRRLAWSLYLAAVLVAIVAGLLSSWLILTAGGEGSVPAAGPVAFGEVVDDELLRLLGASLVLLAALWFGALAASRLESSRPEITR